MSFGDQKTDLYSVAFHGFSWFHSFCYSTSINRGMGKVGNVNRKHRVTACFLLTCLQDIIDFENKECDVNTDFIE